MANVNPPTPSPSAGPVIRKLGKHHPQVSRSFIVPPSLSPSQAPQAEETILTSSVSNIEEGMQEMHTRVRHHSIDKSMAGGGVILGGLATTFLVSVFCYIRATGRHKVETAS
ncbi:hypothetical protein HS088_TW03G01238 [Tripterygium wilfordii]|uniref:Uncharacterized protein n=1 Tax=Tripterygium wilfordii TaxID=458696 RepID=A0A7J7DWZ3_TRIWF|nr:hypothetical protein HS088_TW03G01238 [Tripterygium wilfordii]